MNGTRRAVRVLTVLWPAFVAAGLVDGLLFSLVDPLELHGFGDGSTLSRPAVYTLAFVVFWLLISAASATTLALIGTPEHGASPP